MVQIATLVAATRSRLMAQEMYCPNCGIVAEPKKITPGSFLIELVLWLMLIVPRIFYSLWRVTFKKIVCPGCGAPDMIPTDSPKAIEAQPAPQQTPPAR